LGTTFKTHRDARSLFIQSHSFGDLVMTMALLEGQEFASRASVLLTDHLYAANENGLGIPTFRYRSVEDIVALVRDRQPDLVFFVSAYGVDESLLPLPSLDALVRRLRDLACAVATTDPVLSTTRRLKLSQVDLPLSRLKWRARFRELRNIRRTFRSFSRVARIFEDAVHLYPVPTPGLPPGDNVTRASFFNPRIAEESGGAGDASGPSWLFVIGWSDLKCQHWLWGDSFADLVAQKLEQARRAERRPVLIAPRILVDRVSARLSTDVGAELIPFCSYAEFTSRLARAEYVFYWHLFSCSVLLRLASSRPVFFFDQGHIPRLLKPSYEVGIECYYGGVRPRLLDVRQELDAGALANLVLKQRSDVQAIRAHWATAPEPAELIDRLLRDAAADRNSV
jgi:hypothetical protein